MEDAVTEGEFVTQPSGASGFSFNNLLNQTTNVLASWARSALDRQTLRDNYGEQTPAVATGAQPPFDWKKWGLVALVIVALLFLFTRRP